MSDFDPSAGTRCMWMRGGTSKGGYFLGTDLPNVPEERNAFLLRMMGSPDKRQIDGMGGADPLTSKIAIVQKSARPGIDVDYLFLQAFVDQAIITDTQNCGNILAGVAPFAIERGLVPALNGETEVMIYLENTDQTAKATIQTPNGKVSYAGNAKIDGVPFASAPIPLFFKGTEGSTCGALFPSGNVVDNIAGIDATLIDNGMPCVIMRAGDLGITGLEAREELEANDALCAKLEEIRLFAGPMMNLGTADEVKQKSVPKMTMVNAPQKGGVITTRSFIPHRCHASIGVFAAVSVAAACMTPGSPAAEFARIPARQAGHSQMTLAIEHPTGHMDVVLELDEQGEIISSGLLRTARKLFDGMVFG